MAALVLGAVYAAVDQKRRWGSLQLWGALVVAGSTIGLASAADVPQSVWAGVALLLVAGMAGNTPGLAPLVALPGAWLVVLPADQPLWLAWLALGAIPAAGWSLRELDRRIAALPLLGLLVAGVFLVLPDTEEALVLLGASLPISLLARPLFGARLGPGSYAFIGLVVWVATVGGRDRPGSVLSALGVMAAMLAAAAALAWFPLRAADQTEAELAARPQ